MLTFDEACAFTGHAPGGVCSFALPENVKTYLDVSLKRFDTVFPAAGSANSAIEMTCDELEKYSSNFGRLGRRVQGESARPAGMRGENT